VTGENLRNLKLPYFFKYFTPYNKICSPVLKKQELKILANLLNYLSMHCLEIQAVFVEYLLLS
jgi:hypothetical protein